MSVLYNQGTKTSVSEFQRWKLAIRVETCALTEGPVCRYAELYSIGSNRKPLSPFWKSWMLNGTRERRGGHRRQRSGQVAFKHPLALPGTPTAFISTMPRNDENSRRRGQSGGTYHPFTILWVRRHSRWTWIYDRQL